ncbi:MAG: hypothetical protein E7016_06865 [Alphaproteobacteria bacterium]|nr:hypothetical protein [Alphaproteobacteria bacterium]
MRKYFLLSAVALLATSTANAAMRVATTTIQSDAVIMDTVNVTCNVDFGAIIRNLNSTGEQSVTLQGYDGAANATYSDGITGGYIKPNLDCTLADVNATVFLEANNSDITLSGQDDGNKDYNLSAHLYIEDGSNTVTQATLTIPESTPAGNYRGTITVNVLIN